MKQSNGKEEKNHLTFWVLSGSRVSVQPQHTNVFLWRRIKVPPSPWLQAAPIWITRHLHFWPSPYPVAEIPTNGLLQTEWPSAWAGPNRLLTLQGAPDSGVQEPACPLLAELQVLLSDEEDLCLPFTYCPGYGYRLQERPLSPVMVFSNA